MRRFMTGLVLAFALPRVGAAAEPEALVLKSEHPLSALAVSPDGKTVFAGGNWASSRGAPFGGGVVLRWDVSTGKALEPIGSPGWTVDALALSPDGKTLAGGGTITVPQGSSPGHVELWDPATGASRKRLGSHLDLMYPVHSLAFSPDGKTLAVGGYNTLQLWDVEAGKLRTKLGDGRDAVRSLAFSPDGKLLATGGSRPGKAWAEAVLRLWVLSEGKQERLLDLERCYVTSVAFAPDGKTLAAAGGLELTPLVKLWDVGARKERVTPKGHSGYVHAVAFAPDGKTLATASHDHTITLWDAATGEERRTLRGPTGGVLALVFAPDGKALVSAGEDKTVRVWQLAK